MKILRFIFVSLLLASVVVSCEKQPKVKNVIFLIGDGMGMGAVSSLVLSEEAPTGFELATVIGLSETASANNHVSDSPAGGTALATGVRTVNGHTGVDPEGRQLTSILYKAQAMGKKTGIVVNTTLTESTPAAFYGGVTSRKMTYELARQLTESNVDLAIGAGLDHFVGRPDSLDLTATFIEKGYDVYLNWSAVLNTRSDKFIGILPLADVHRREEKTIEAGAADGQEVCLAARLAAQSEEVDTTQLSEPTLYLEKATAKALDVLSRNNKNGFFLMVESAIIDGYGHNNDTEGLVEEMREFDRTLKMLISYVQQNPETLLVVTGDHETGGVAVSYREFQPGENPSVLLRYTTKGHSGTFVPVFAYGAGAESFAGVMKNIDIPNKIMQILK